MSRHLLIIDPQFDFCDPNGALYVAGADADMRRLAAFLRRNGDSFDAVHVTLDSHHFFDIAHPAFWRGSDSLEPAPFTQIRAEDLAAEIWQTARPQDEIRAAAYIAALDAGGRYALTIWPPHCLIGSPGNAVVSELFHALKAWEQSGRTVDFVPKGQNIYTEHYSALRAEAPDPSDPTTQRNTKLLKALGDSDEVLVAGEAGSHCVANTVRDVVTELGEAFAPKLTLLTDTISPVTGFEALQEQLLADMTALGVKLTTTI